MRKIAKKEFNLTDDPFYSLEKTASATECTGLIPCAPETCEEIKNYSALYAVHAPEETGEDKPKQ